MFVNHMYLQHPKDFRVRVISDTLPHNLLLIVNTDTVFYDI